MTKKETLFDKAKKKGKTTKKVEKHEVVNLPELEKPLKRMADINKSLKELEAEKAIIDSQIRDAGKNSLLTSYSKTQKFPGTLKIQAGSMEYQFITSDKYKKVDEERAEELTEIYGEDIITEETTYSFNTAILMKHMQHISDLLMNSKKLSEQDKEEILDSITTYAVAKGSVKDLFQYKDEENEDTPETFVDTIIEDIQPVFSVKGVKESE